ncbi:MAG: hypothetical protein H7196_04785 [candidate division SR1 bacterium]|nr:hypothetical protein [candidate division SR1 bacterium]
MNKYIFSSVAIAIVSLLLQPVIAQADGIVIKFRVGDFSGKIGDFDHDQRYRNRQRYYDRQYNRADYDGYYNNRRTTILVPNYNNNQCYTVDQNGNKYKMNCNSIRQNNNVDTSDYENNYDNNNSNNNGGGRTTVFCQDTRRTQCRTVTIN